MYSERRMPSLAMVLHLALDVAPWGPDPALAALEGCLVAAGSRSVPWRVPDGDALEDDGDHFTVRGYTAWVEAVADALAPDLAAASAVRVLTDSTVGFHDWDHDTGAHTGWASRTLTHALGQRMGRPTSAVHVDAVNGSGFVARARHGEHFHARLAHALHADATSDATDAASGTDATGPPLVVFVGGWNDVREGPARAAATCRAAAACVALAQRGTRRARSAGPL